MKVRPHAPESVRSDAHCLGCVQSSETGQLAVEVVDLRRLQILAEIHSLTTRHLYRPRRMVSDDPDLGQRRRYSAPQEQISVEMGRAFPKQDGIADVQDRSKQGEMLAPVPPE